MEGEALLGALATIAVLGAAEPDPPREPELPAPAIIVTGERVARTLRETAASVAVTTERSLDEQAAPDRVDQILELTPNVQMSSGGEGPTIRGLDTTGALRDLPAFLGGNQPRTTLIVDGRAVSFNEFVFGAAPVWDVERIEIFRTPQTTTQGRNSISGAIFVHTKDPAATPDYRARAIAGSLKRRQVSAALSLPLVADRLAVRLAGDYRFGRPGSKINDLAVGTTPNRDVHGLLRAKLLATPTALPGSRFELAYMHSRSQMPQIEGVRPPFEKREDPIGAYGTFRIDTDSATLSTDFAPATGLSVNALVTAGDSRIRRFAPEGLGQSRVVSRDWSAETILTWKPGGPLLVTGGISHTQARLRQFIDVSRLSGIGRFRDRQSGTGFFGEATLALSDKAEVRAGLRYQLDRKRRAGLLTSRSSPLLLDFERSFEALLPKISFAYDLSPALRVGLLVQRAYNPGGTTLRLDTGQPDTFEAERLWDYELFARSTFAGGKLVASANLFHYDIRDAQRAQPISILTPNGVPLIFVDLFNAARARSRGLEASLDWKPGDRLSLSAGLGLLDTRIIDGGDHRVLEGKHFQRAPRFSASASVRWRPFDTLVVSAQMRSNSRYFSDDLNDPVRAIDGWSRIDGKASWNTGRLELFAYVRNLLDDFHLTYLFNPTLGTAGHPRELGAGVEARF